MKERSAFDAVDVDVVPLRYGQQSAICIHCGRIGTAGKRDLGDFIAVMSGLTGRVSGRCAIKGMDVFLDGVYLVFVQLFGRVA